MERIRTADEIIREECEADEWCEDEETVAECTYCGRAIRRGDEMLSALDADGNPVRLCYWCADSRSERIPVVDLLQLLGLWGRYDEDAENGEAVLDMIVQRRRAMMRGMKV